MVRHDQSLSAPGHAFLGKTGEATTILTPGATVTNLDWPSVSSVAITDEAARVSKQKEELTGILDEI
ncbi:hypothetical protein QCD76_27660, partial [Pseudomonas syringae]